MTTVGGHRAAASRAVLLLVLACMAVSNLGCGNGGGAVAAPPPRPPQAFEDDSLAELASDGKDLWLLVAGFDRRGAYGLRVFRLDHGAWASLPEPYAAPSPDHPISIALTEGTASRPAAPCLGYAEARQGAPVVACWSGAEWNRATFPARAGEALLELVGDSPGGLRALLLAHDRSGAASYRVLRRSEDGWRREGPEVPASTAVASLAANAGEGGKRPTIGIVTQSARSTRYALQLRDGRWRKLGRAIRGRGIGPMIGGPVMVNGKLIFPVNDAAHDPWSFSAVAIPIRSGSQGHVVSLSKGFGNSQGRLDAVGEGVWASWQEDKPLPDGRFRVAIFAAELGAHGVVRRKVRLWRGTSIGPGSTQVVSFRGGALALYMPAAGDEGNGLRVALRRLP